MSKILSLSNPSTFALVEVGELTFISKYKGMEKLKNLVTKYLTVNCPLHTHVYCSLYFREQKNHQYSCG